MHRVSSRQRLVSWDAFDATCSDGEEDFFQESYQTSFDLGETSSKRKRSHVIPVYTEYCDLPQESILLIASHLNRRDLGNLMGTDKQHHELLSSNRALNLIWKPLYRGIWEFLDDAEITTDLKFPQVIDLAVRKPAKIESPLTNEIEVSDTIKFTGTVGIGDRCVRADRSLPTPRLCKRKNFVARMKFGKYYHEPFVAPFRNSDGSWNLQQRLTSYFEVSILSGEKSNSPTPECVAVGIATAAFNVQSRMPGWDRESFGFHGDDGGIFHNAGSMRKLFGRSFGSSDVIGCGIDYGCQKIFYTRNGQFLGYAFSLKEHQLAASYYPVIGMDTSLPITCNFGQTPFCFDLSSMVHIKMQGQCI